MKDEEKEKLEETRDWIPYLERIYRDYSDARFRFERNWYISDNFFDGNHFVWYRKESGTIDRINPPRGTVLRAINKASKLVEAVQNLIVSNNAKWTAYPEADLETGQVDEEAEQTAHRQAQFLEYVFDQLNMKERQADLVLYALKFPVAFWEFYPTDDGISIGCNTYDAFDILFKPDIDSLYDSPVLFKTIEKTPEEIKANPDYDISDEDDVVVNPEPYASELKSLRYNEKYGTKTGTGKKSTVTLKEAWVQEWFKETVTKEVDTGIIDPVTGEPVMQEVKEERRKKVIRVVTYISGMKEPLRNKETAFDDFPFVAYAPKSGALYQPSLLEKVMSANKSLDLIVSGIEQFMHTMNKGRWLKHRNAYLSKIYNETGQIIEWDVEKPELVAQQSIPNYFFTHIGNLEKWIEEQTVNAASLGRNPQGVRAYKTIETLKSSDMSNQAVAITRLETALEKAAEIILEIADKYFDKPQTIHRMNKEEPDYFNVIGARYKQPEDGSIPLSSNTKVNVSVESGLSYTQEGKRQTLLELFYAGLVDKQTVLEGFKFGNVGEILQKVSQEQMQTSMVDTADFGVLSDETKKVVLQELIDSNVSLTQPASAVPEKGAVLNRKRVREGGGFGNAVQNR
jgi:hypothetical protein